MTGNFFYLKNKKKKKKKKRKKILVLGSKNARNHKYPLKSSFVNCLLQVLFHKIYEYSHHEYKVQNKILKRSVSCFSKLYALHELDKVKMKQKILSKTNV